MKKYKHLMLDIETMGNQSYSAIVSIGAVEFDIETGETGREFEVGVDLQSCIDYGLHPSASTIEWWLGQSEDARQQLLSLTKLPLPNALELFSMFCNKDYQIWGNSARFDCGIIQNAYDKIGLPIPWDFRKERCLRTLVSMNPSVRDNTKFTGTPHNAVDDCKHQIKYCSGTWKNLNVKEFIVSRF